MLQFINLKCTVCYFDTFMFVIWLPLKQCFSILVLTSSRTDNKKFLDPHWFTIHTLSILFRLLVWVPCHQSLRSFLYLETLPLFLQYASVYVRVCMRWWWCSLLLTSFETHYFHLSGTSSNIFRQHDPFSARFFGNAEGLSHAGPLGAHAWTQHSLSEQSLLFLNPKGCD